MRVYRFGFNAETEAVVCVQDWFHLSGADSGKKWSWNCWWELRAEAEAEADVCVQDSETEAVVCVQDSIGWSYDNRKKG